MTERLIDLFGMLVFLMSLGIFFSMGYRLGNSERQLKSIRRRRRSPKYKL